METRLLTGPFLRVWLATLGAFATFGMVVLALPLYVKDQLGYGSVGVGLAMGAASITSVIFSIVSGRLGDRHGRRPLLIAVTGYGQRSDRERTTAAGFQAHVVKPVDFQHLSALLDRLFAAEPAR